MKRVAKETWLLGVICVADLVSTLVLVAKYGADEGNGFMRFYLQLGVWAFVAAKVAMFVGPLVVLEWARRTRPQFVRTMLRICILLYVSSYTVSLLRERASASQQPTDEEIANILAWTDTPSPYLHHHGPSASSKAALRGVHARDAAL